MTIDQPKSIDQKINEAFEPIAKAISDTIFYAEPITGYDIKLILVWLVLISLFLTIYFGFINLRYFKHSIDILRGKFDKDGDSGQINRFQALTTSLSGTVGLGNIGGVAVAVSTGGPGALFWMAMMGLFGMSAKFAEAALGVKYRVIADDGQVSGGPMYYIKAAFEKIGAKKLGAFFAFLFAVCVVGGAVGAGNMFQSNQAFQQLVNVTGGEESALVGKGWIFGLCMAVLVGAVIIGGLKSIAGAASKIVPLMGAIYLLAGLIVIAMNVSAIPAGFATIFQTALTPEAGFGAVLGALLIGVQRAAFSNEAGIGSAAIPHSAAKTNDHVSQGFVGMLGPFIDTIVICMVTGLVIVMSGAYNGSEGMEGVTLTSNAFESGIPWFPYVLTLTVFLFAFSTMIAWFYYGLKGLQYLLGDCKVSENIYKVAFCAFIVIGASMQLGSIINFSDAMIFAMAIPNVLALYLLAPELKSDIKRYLQNIDINKK